MLIHSYLSLHTGQLKPLEKWGCEGDELFLVFPKSGAWQMSSAGNQFRLAGGDAVVMSGRSGVKLTPLSETETALSWFSVSLDSLFPLFAAAEICFLQKMPQVLRTPKVYAAANPVTQQCHRLLAEIPAQCDLNHRSQILRVAALILSDELKSWQQQQFGLESAGDHMMRIFEQLSSEQLLKLSAAELSQKFGCSRRHLSRLFHQRFGLSVGAFRMEMRMLRASSLLRDPGVKVTNVAEQCGFNHLGLFNSCFKRRFGVTPGLWRNMQTEKGCSEKTASNNETCPLHLSGLCARNPAAEFSGPRPRPGSPIQPPKTVLLGVIPGRSQATKTTARPKPPGKAIRALASIGSPSA
jgi:AraC-like DNA-binding protein